MKISGKLMGHPPTAGTSEKFFGKRRMEHFLTAEDFFEKALARKEEQLLTKSRWKTRIKKSCTEVGTYKKSFDGVIDALAEILEKRDQTLEEYDGNPIISHTNSHGETNRMKNPALMLWDELNKTALSYWRDLGLTPKGLKAINEEAMEKKKTSSLAEVLKSIGG